MFPELVNAADSEKYVRSCLTLLMLRSTPLHYASLSGEVPMLAFLFTHGARLNTDSNQETPLHAAAMNGRLDAVKHLMKRVR